MKIAIVGAGLAGLGLAWHLLAHLVEVTVFDEKGIGGGASGVASGLLHPFPASATRLSFKGYEALHHSLVLLKVAEKYAEKKIADYSGIIKLALEDTQKREYSALMHKYDRIQWWSKERLALEAACIKGCPGLFLEQGVTVFCQLYLQALWQACAAKGAKFVNQGIGNMEELAAYDRVVRCVGASLQNVDPSWKLQYVKGQLLIVKSLSCLTKKSLLGKGYIAVTEDPYIYHIGSTYEHQFIDGTPNFEVASRLLKRQLSVYVQKECVDQLEFIGCEAAIRVTNPRTYLPMIKKYNAKHYAVTALGSRGLLYHSLIGKQLADAIVLDDEKKVYSEFLF
jgi:glycine/D-amino acid oxidase-like deaminating enzyme